MEEKFYQELNIPSIPNHLLHLDPNYIVNNYSNVWKVFDTEVYRQYQVSKNLIDFLQPFFDFDITANLKYQILSKDIPIHKDVGRIKAINYLIDPGGEDVKTTWYSDDLVPLFEKEILKNKWHTINTEIKHGISGIKDKRLALTISIYN